MIGQVLLVTISGLLAACAPQPRSPADFAKHPAEAAQVLAGCAAGRVRGVACTNADLGAARAAAAERQAAYRKGF